MQYHTPGGNTTGDPIAEIVPQSEELVIEASMSALDIDRIQEGQNATIRFSHLVAQSQRHLGVSLVCLLIAYLILTRARVFIWPE